MGDGIAVINAGSSSIKFSVYVADPVNGPNLTSRGFIEEVTLAPHFVVRDPDGVPLEEQHWRKADNPGFDALLVHLIDWIESHLGTNRLCAAGHRVVMGGQLYRKPVLISDEVLEALESYVPLVPLHQPHNLLPIRRLQASHPHLPQVACFDTAFHGTKPQCDRIYALPWQYADQGVLAYGFHGLSYEYIARILPDYDPAAARGRVITAHLGSGASLCAMLQGRSVATTMGFSALDGLVMGTRCGSLDPGVLLYLIQQEGMDGKALEALLYKQSGLLGVSGISNDMRGLLYSKDPRAKEAVDLFVYRVVKELGALAATLEGLDTLVFTAGIGENAPVVRERICTRSRWLGVKLDHAANLRGGPCISSPDSKVSVWVIPTNEEYMIAKHTIDCIATLKEKETT